MSDPTIPIGKEAELVRQLTQLLIEEQRWFAHDIEGPSPYLGQRAALLKALEAAANERGQGAGPPTSEGIAELRHAVMALQATHARSLDMVRVRMAGLDRVRKQLAQRHAYGPIPLAQDCLGQG